MHNNRNIEKIIILILTTFFLCVTIYVVSTNADVAELADALVLGTSANGVEVRVLSSAPMAYLFELNWIEGYKYHSEKNGIFLLQKSNKLYCLAEHTRYDGTP